MHETSFIPLLIVIGAALVTGLVLPKLPWVRVPVVVGEILTGIALGRSGFGVIEPPSPEHPQPWLELLSLFGFTFLMFLSGLEIDMRGISVAITGVEGAGAPVSSSRLRTLLIRTFAIFGVTLVVSLVLAEVLVLLDYLESPYMVALIMSTTSVGLVMPFLKERGEASSTFGQVVILSAVVADFVTMLLITVVVAFYEHHRLTLDLLVYGTLFVAVFAVYWLGKRLLHTERSILKRIVLAAPKTAEVGVRAALTLMLALVVLSQVIGTEIILGAFMAGALVSALMHRTAHGRLGMKLDAIGFGLFIPIFFITVGVEFDLASLLADPMGLALVPILVVFAFLVKVVPSLLLTKFFGRRNALAAGFLISARLSLIIAASAIGLRLGVISEALNSAIILVAIITCLASPALYSALRRGEKRWRTTESVDLDPLLGHMISRDEHKGITLQLVELGAYRFPQLVGKTVAETKLRQLTGLTLLEVVRTDGSIVENPGPDFVIEETDRLFLVGKEEQIEKMEELAAVERRSLLPPMP